MEEEIWRLIPGRDAYEVSSLGRVRSWFPWQGSPSPRLLTQFTQANGYKRVCFAARGGKSRDAFVHHIVLEAFVGPRPPGWVACHAPDPDRANNRLDNLRWASRTENSLDRLRHGNNPLTSIRVEDVPVIMGRLAAGEKLSEVACDYGVPKHVIRRIKSGVTFSHALRDHPELMAQPKPASAITGPVFVPPNIALSSDEIWAPVPHWPGYEVSSFGRVRSSRRGDPVVLRLQKASNGYRQVSLSDRGRSKLFLVHHLVLMVFACPRPAGAVACHDDGDRENNHASNLRWDTIGGNVADRYRHRKFGSNVKLTPEQVSAIRMRLDSGSKVKDLAAEYNVSLNAIYLIRRSTSWLRVPRFA